MATIKSYTDLEQSKKLAEILPLELESADMLHCIDFHGNLFATVPKQYSGSFRYQPELIIPCWSLTALLGVLPEKYTELIKEGGMYRVIIKDSYMTSLFYNSVDACVVMIKQLHELNLL